ncbi:EamA family transporter [Nocardia brasiliensis]
MAGEGGPGIGVWLVFGGGFAFASIGPLLKSVLVVGWSPGAVLLIRLVGAASIMVLLAAFADPAGLRTCPHHLRTIVVFGVVAVTGTQATLFLALQTLPVAVALMIQFLAPIAVIGWNWAVRRRRPSRTTMFGTVAALGGAALVVDVFGAGGGDLPGLGWAALSMLCHAAYFLLSESSAAKLRPVTLLGAGMTVSVFLVSALGVLGLLPLRVGSWSASLAGVDIPATVSLVLLIVLGTVVAHLSGVAGAALIGSTLTSLILLSEVVFAALLAWLLLGESIGPGQAIGGVLVVGGIAGAYVGAERNPR